LPCRAYHPGLTLWNLNLGLPRFLGKYDQQNEFGKSATRKKLGGFFIGIFKYALWLEVMKGTLSGWFFFVVDTWAGVEPRLLG